MHNGALSLSSLLTRRSGPRYSPWLPNTGPGVARSRVTHIANPSPYMDMPLPSTWGQRGCLSTFYAAPPGHIRRGTSAWACRGPGSPLRGSRRGTHVKLKLDLPVGHGKRQTAPEPPALARPVLCQAHVLVGVDDCVASKVPPGVSAASVASARPRRGGTRARPWGPRAPTRAPPCALPKEDSPAVLQVAVDIRRVHRVRLEFRALPSARPRRAHLLDHVCHGRGRGRACAECAGQEGEREEREREAHCDAVQGVCDVDWEGARDDESAMTLRVVEPLRWRCLPRTRVGQTQPPPPLTKSDER